MVGAGLLALYEATFDRRWLDECAPARRGGPRPVLGRRARRFFDTGADHEALDRAAAQHLRQCRAVRQLGGDRLAPAPGAVTRRGALRGARARGAAADGRSDDALPVGLRAVSLGARLPPGPRGRGRAGLARRAGKRRPRHCSHEVFARYLPNRVVAGAAEGAAIDGLPLLAERGAVGGRATAYVCRRYVCQMPVTTPEALARQLEGVYSESPTRGEVS